MESAYMDADVEIEVYIKPRRGLPSSWAYRVESCSRFYCKTL